MGIRLLREATLRKGTRVIVRADLDIALLPDKRTETYRIDAVLPTLRFLIRNGARLRIIGHRGRPKGRRDPRLSLAPLASYFSRRLRCRVIFVENSLRFNQITRVEDSARVILLENLRFWPGEEDNTVSFARSLAQWGEIYVNEAFANCHRAHASMVPLAKILPSYAGFHLADEVAALNRVLKKPQRPFIAILGGVKIETKLPLIQRFLREADRVLVGGALANTLLAFMGKAIGKSVADTNERAPASILRSKKLYLPSDVVVADGLNATSRHRVWPVKEVGRHGYIVDIGPASQSKFVSLLAGAKTVVWNGPLGFAEVREFAKGTIAIAGAVRRLHAFTLVGGGDTLATLWLYRLLGGFSHISTGGGAMLEFLAGRKLPAIEALGKRL